MTCWRNISAKVYLEEFRISYELLATCLDMPSFLSYQVKLSSKLYSN